MWNASVLAPVALAAVLLLSGWAKRGKDVSTRSVIELLRLPQVLRAPWVAAALPWGEIALAVLLLVTPSPLFWVPAVAALVLMAFYWGVIARALTFDPRPSCGCFGQIGDQSVSPKTLVRNTILVLAGAVTVAIAAAGRSTISLLTEQDGSEWIWLVAALALGALTWLVVHDGSASVAARNAAAAAATSAVTLTADDAIDAPVESTELDYVREVIPHTLLLDATGTPSSLGELIREKARLLVFVNCYCGSTTWTATQIPTWREQLPQIGVDMVWSVPPAPLRDGNGEAVAEDALVDHAMVAWNALKLPGSPAAVLLGADGLLAGGPVHGEDQVAEFVEDIVASLSEAPDPAAEAESTDPTDSRMPPA